MKTRTLLTLISLLLLSQSSFAFSWQDLWFSKNQQGARSLAHGKPELAAKEFTNPNWKAVAQYRAGQYQQTVDTLKPLNTTRAHYNQGNALAHMGQYQAAIDQYTKAIKLDPQNADAKFNKALLEKLLKKQPPQQKQQQQQQSQNSNKNKNKKHSQNKQQQSSNKQKSQAKNNKQNNNQPKPKPKNQQQAKNKPQQQPRQQQKSKPTTVQQRQRQAQQKATKQWLRQIPDDPGGLLRQKFLRDHRRLQREGAHVSW